MNALDEQDRPTAQYMLNQLLRLKRIILYDVLKSLDAQIPDFKINWTDEK